MKKRDMAFLLGVAVVVVIPSVSRAIGEGWTDNFEEAKEQAAAEGKDILIDFTGSDWCGWCIKLDNEVFKQEAFKVSAPKDFVLVVLDFPRDKSLVSEETAKQNEQLKEQFAIRGFPTLYLTDAAGRPYAKASYQAGGPENYLEYLAGLKAVRQVRDKGFAAAKAESDNLARARLIDAVLEALGPAITSRFYDAEIQQIINLDAGNTAGLKSKYGQMLQDETFKRLMRAKKFTEVIALLEERIREEKPEGEALMELELTQARTYAAMRETKKSLKLADDVIARNNLKGPALQDALLIKYNAYWHSGDKPNQTRIMKEIVAADPDSERSKRIQKGLDEQKAKSRE